MAISANGIIATKDGGEDFFSDENWLNMKKWEKRLLKFGIK